jgi:translation initiation factor 1
MKVKNPKGKNTNKDIDYELVYTDDPKEIDKIKQTSTISESFVPSSTTLKIRIEKNQRGGKIVTVIYDLPNNAHYFTDLTKKLKNQCGTGGTFKDDHIELQGDQKEKASTILLKLGFKVKG